MAHDYCMSQFCAPADMWVAYATVGLVIVTFGLALYTAKLYRATVRLGKEAERTSSRQGGEMAESIKQASLAATAMSSLAASMEVSVQAAKESAEILRQRSALQLRAFLTVSTGVSAYQERYRDVRFQAVARVRNSGNTPALHVRTRSASAFMARPLPEDFEFPLPSATDDDPGFTLGSGQESDIWAPPFDYFPEEDVPDLKAGTREVLTFWGIVTYDDIFGESHSTKFCHSIHWRSKDAAEMVYAVYERGFDGMT